jgi:hypothetical protein
VKTNGIKAFKSTNVGLNIDIVPYKASDNTTQQYLILQGKINDKNSRQNPPPRPTDPLPNAAIAIAKDIQAEALIQHDELYDILLLDRSHSPDVQVDTEALTQSEAASLITPTKEDSSHPITTSTEEVQVHGSIVTPTNDLSPSTVMLTGVAIENGFVDSPELVRMMQHTLSLLQSSDQAGAEKVLESVKDVKSAQTYYNWQVMTLGEKHKVQVRIPKTCLQCEERQRD